METVIMNKIKNKYYATFMVVTIILTAGFVLAANAYEPKCYTGQGAGGNISCGSINSVAVKLIHVVKQYRPHVQIQ